MKKIIIKKVFPNPENLKRLCGIKGKIVSSGMRGNELIIRMEEEPSQTELDALLTLVKTENLWTIEVEEEEEKD